LALGLLSAAASIAQTTVAPPTNYITAPFVTSLISGAGQTSITGLVAYDINLSPASLYVGSPQLAADAQAFLSAYPSPDDPVEAIVSSIATSILQKYPQINEASMTISVLSVTQPLASRTATAYVGTIGHSQASATSAANTNLHKKPAEPAAQR
jgi:hypothetical protein